MLVHELTLFLAAAPLAAATGDTPSVRVLQGHFAEIDALAFRPDGSELASGGEDSRIVVWQRRTWMPQRVFRRTDHVHQLAYHPVEPWLAVGEAGMLSILDANSGATLETLAAGNEADGIGDLAFSPDGKYFAATFNSSAFQPGRSGIARQARLAVWQTGIWARVYRKDQDFESLPSCTFTTDSRQIVLLDAARGQLVVEPIEGFGEPRAVGLVGTNGKPWEDLAPLWESHLRVPPRYNNTACVRFLDGGREALVTGVPLQRIAWRGALAPTVVDSVGATSLTTHSSAKQAAVITPDGVQLFDGTTGRLSAPVANFDVRAVAISDAARLIAVAHGRSVRVWHLDHLPYGPLADLESSEGGPRSVRFTEDGRFLIGENFDRFELWNLAPGAIQPGPRRTSASTELFHSFRRSAGRGEVTNAIGLDSRSRHLTTIVQTAIGVEVRDFEAGETVMTHSAKLRVTDPDATVAHTVAVDLRHGRLALVLGAWGVDHKWLDLRDMYGGQLLWRVEKLPEATPDRLVFSRDGRILSARSVTRGLPTLSWSVEDGRSVPPAEGYDDEASPGERWRIEREYSPPRCVVHDAASGAKATEIPSDERPAIGFDPAEDRIAVAQGSVVTIVDLPAGTEAAHVEIGDEHPWAVALHPNERLLAVVHLGYTELRNVASGAVLARLYGVGDDAGLALAPSGCYAGTPNATRWIVFDAARRTMAFDQFDLFYNRPDRVFSGIGLSPRDWIATLERAWQLRVERHKPTEAPPTDVRDRPVLEILDRQLPSATNDERTVLRVRAQRGYASLRGLRAWVNKVPLDTDALPPLHAGTPNLELDVPVPLTSGRNWIEVTALDERGIESYRDMAIVVRTGPPVAPALYVGAVGVNHNLRFAAADAERVEKYFEEHKSSYREVHVDRVPEERATASAIDELGAFLEQADTGDIVVLYFAGHGKYASDGRYYFATVDMDFDQPAEKGYSFERMFELLKHLRTRRKLLLLDTCHSGFLATNLGEVVANTPNDRASLDPQPGAVGVTPRAIGTDELFAESLVDELFRDLRPSSGTTVIGATSGQGLAQDDPKIQGGFFTHALLSALDSAATDVNGNGAVELSELRKRAYTDVVELSHGKQTPTVQQELLLDDFEVLRRERVERGAGPTGLRAGPWTVYHSNGQPFATGEYTPTGERRIGCWTHWYPSGQKLSEGGYVACDSSATPLDEAARLPSYAVRNFRQGRWTFWYENGRKLAEGEFLLGDKCGTWTTWFESGVKRTECRFAKHRSDGSGSYDSTAEDNWLRFGYRPGEPESGDEVLGLWTFWREDGTKEREGVRANDTWTWTYFHANGTPQRRGSTDMLGSMVGPWSIWDEQGRLAAQGQWEGNVPNGAWTLWHPNGAKKGEGRMLAGSQQGMWRLWSESGRLLLEGEFDAGVMHGSVSIWNEDGTLDPRSGHYERGQRVGN